MKKIITVESEALEMSTYFTTLKGLIEWVDSVRKDFPEDSYLKGYVSGYDGDSYTIAVSADRQESDYEYENRLNREKWEKKRVEDDEKEIYRRLKEKFEG